MGIRATLLTFGAAALAALPPSAFAATTNFFGPIVPQSGRCLCDGPQATAMDWGCLLQVFQSILNFLVSFSLLAVVFFIAWGGFTLITSGGNPSARTQATNRMLNAVVGLVLILGAWLIVDTVMKYLYNPSTAFSGAQFGPWNTILGSDPNAYCLRYNANPGVLNHGLNGTALQFSDFINPGISNSSTATGLGTGDCSPATLKAGAAKGGYNLTDPQAQTLSCIAIPESSCGTNRNIPHTPDGTPTSARGMFQIVLGGSDTCHSLNLPVCTQAAQAAGWTGGQLNCSTAFSGGSPKAGQETRARACQAAALNTDCNVSAAACLLKKDPSFGDWAGSSRADTRATAQAACVQKYNT